MSRYRILRLITWLPVGGIERKIAAVLPRLDRDLFEVHLCCIRERGPLADELEQAGIPVHLVRFRSRWDPFAMRRLSALTQSLGIDLIHSHMYRANVPATALKMMRRPIKVVGHYHNVDTWESPGQLRVDRHLAARRDMNACVSGAVRRDVVARLGIDPSRTCTLYNGVDLEEFRPATDDERMVTRRDLGIAPDAVVAVVVARLVRQKNQEALIRLIPELAAAQPRAYFLFLGSGPDEARLREAVTLAGVENHVQFAGSRPDVARIAAASDFSVLPSLKEGFSNTILESMACGLPVVASRVGGNAEVIESAVSGFLCDAHFPADQLNTATAINESQLSRFVKRLLADAGLRRRMGRAARQRVSRFGIDSMVREAEQLYRSLLEPAP